MHACGDAVRAAVILAQVLKRDPSDAEAVELLLHLYVEELPGPGIESDLLKVLSRQPNGADLLAIVEAELEEVGGFEKLKALDKVMDAEPVHLRSAHEAPAPQPEPEPVAPANSPQARAPSSEFVGVAAPPVARGDNWDGFDSPFEEETGRVQIAEPAPAIAAREQADPLTLSMSQPLGTIDTLPPSLRAEYGPRDAPLPSDLPASGSRLVWVVLACVAMVVVGAILAYTMNGDAEAGAQPEAWPEEGSAQ